MSLVVGVGSPHGDDQLGWLAVDRLCPLLPSGYAVHKVQGGLDLLDCLEGHEAAIIIDAAAPAGQPGRLRSFTWPCPELASFAQWSTHGVGLVEAFQLAESLGWLPRRVKIHTIEAQDGSPGAPLSKALARPLDSVVEAVLCDVSCGDEC
jgi:hydrogenase maturation protease